MKQVFQCLGQPIEIVHSPCSKFELHLNFGFESDLKKKFSETQVQISFKSEFKKNSDLNQF